MRRGHVRGRLSDQAHRLGQGKSIVEADRPDPGAAALKYVFEVDDPEAVVENSGFVKVRYAGTGFLMIRREAL